MVSSKETLERTKMALRLPFRGLESSRRVFHVTEHLDWLMNETLGVRVKVDFFLHFIFNQNTVGM